MGAYRKKSGIGRGATLVKIGLKRDFNVFKEYANTVAFPLALANTLLANEYFDY